MSGAPGPCLQFQRISPWIPALPACSGIGPLHPLEAQLLASVASFGIVDVTRPPPSRRAFLALRLTLLSWTHYVH